MSKRALLYPSRSLNNNVVKRMVFRLDGCSFHYEHIWSKSGISICWLHSITSEDTSNPIFFSEKTYFTSYVRNMFWATILSENHDRWSCSTYNLKKCLFFDVTGARKGFLVGNIIILFTALIQTFTLHSSIRRSYLYDFILIFIHFL